jgi:4'-phosphopantetheinyl transferase EntD
VPILIEKNPALLSASLGALFPSGALVAEMREPGDATLLYPDEAAHLGRAVPKRVQEFAAGRLCARRVLTELGINDFPLKAALDRQPVWPLGIVGSITHTTGFVAAVAGERKRMAALGLDCELAGSVKTELWQKLFRDNETRWLRRLPTSQQAAAATLMFCAKEAFYKCQYPLTGEWLNFRDAWVELPAWGAGQGIFNLYASRPIALASHAQLPMRGRYLFHEPFVTAGVALPA